MIKTPSKLLIADSRPLIRLVPPMTTAAIVDSSIANARVEVRRLQVGHVKDSAESSKQARDAEYNNLQRARVDTRQAHGLLVRPDRDRIASEDRAGQHHVPGQHHGHRQKEGRRESDARDRRPD